MVRELVVAVVAGLIQGVLEWLPVSSEGGVTVAMTMLGASPTAAVNFALFLHAGTAIAATAYYRTEVLDTVRAASAWTPRNAFRDRTAELSFLVLGTLSSAVVGVVVYLLLQEAVSTLQTGAFVAIIGLLLVGTGVLQRTASDARVALDVGKTPRPLDAVLVGSLQGLALLPGVSRSGTTVSALLIRGYEGESAFELSFLLSIPAAAAAGVLVVFDHGGLPAVRPASALLAVVTATVVGYAAIDVLMRLVRRTAFWAVCLVLGALTAAVGLSLLFF